MFEEEKELRRRRRNDRKRVKEKARRVVKSTFYGSPKEVNTLHGKVPVEEWIINYTNRHAENMAKCSCSMCGNPRHSVYSKGNGKITLQELQGKLTEKEQMEDLD